MCLMLMTSVSKSVYASSVMEDNSKSVEDKTSEIIELSLNNSDNSEVHNQILNSATNPDYQFQMFYLCCEPVTLIMQSDISANTAASDVLKPVEDKISDILQKSSNNNDNTSISKDIFNIEADPYSSCKFVIKYNDTPLNFYNENKRTINNKQSDYSLSNKCDDSMYSLCITFNNTK